MRKQYKGVILIVASAFGFGLLPIFAVFAYDFKVTVSTLLLLRFTAASAVFFTYIAVRKIKLGLNPKSLLYFILLGGVCYTLQSTFYFNSVRYISPSLAVLIMYTYPLFVAILSMLLYKERLGKRAVTAMVFSFAGLIVITGASLGHIDKLGMLLAFLAAIVYSVYIVLGNHVVKVQEPLVTSAFVTLFAAAGVLVSGLPAGTLRFDFDPRALLPAAGIAFFSTIVAVFGFLKGLEYVTPTKASILSMLEPVFTVILTAVLLNSSLTLLQVAGGSVALAGAAIVAVSRKKD